jgi:N-acetylneuraminate synthase
MTPEELHELIIGSRIIHQCLDGAKGILPEEQPTIDFAYATVVAIRDIKAGEIFSKDNIWVKRPGTGEILAADFELVLGKKAAVDINDKTQIRRAWIA